MSGSDKTEAPTPKRKREARKEGRIAKSQELVTWGSVLFGTMLLPMTLRAASSSCRQLFTQMGETIAEPRPEAALGLLGAGGGAIIASTMPLALGMAGFAIVANLAQTRGVVATKKLKPSAKNLNVLQGIKRLFSVHSAWNTFKILARTGALALAAWLPLRGVIDRMSGADRPSLVGLMGSIASDGMAMIRLVAVAGLLLGVVDYLFQHRQTSKQLKMSKQDIKDESRQSEGDPHVKGQIRSKQREMSRNRMLAAVADASVVIVNPTHVAVALKYEAGGGAPRLVAKGKGEVARRIREAAEEHRVPMVRDIPLARALHDTCKLDHPVPAELYAAVAKVLAFVLTVGKRAAAMGGVVSLNRA